MSALARTVLAASILIGAGPAVAAGVEGASGVPGCEPPPPTLVRSLVDWIAERTDYDVEVARADPPVIRFALTGEEIPAGSESMIVEPGDTGAYDIERRTIWLVAPWSPACVADRGVLLHELVHDVQFLNRTFRCPRASEKEAYRLQEEWAREEGLDLTFSPMFVFMASLCRPEAHPR
jgi:hypothetical protein